MTGILLTTVGVAIAALLLLVFIGVATHVIAATYFRNRLHFLLMVARLSATEDSHKQKEQGT